MKRRGFLRLFGAAVATPLLPTPVVSAAAKRAVPYSAAAMHAAIYHAQSRAVFSVWGLAKAVNLSIDQAEALMGDLAKRGITGPLQGTTFGGRWASSKIMTQEALAVRTAQQRINGQLGQTAGDTTPAKVWSEPDLSPLWNHIRAMADRYLAASQHAATS